MHPQIPKSKPSRRQWLLAGSLCVLPVLLFLAARWLRPAMLQVFVHIPVCPSYEKLHLYCPGCGNTRSVMALLRGDILGSIRYNVTPVLLAVLGGLWYVQGILRVLGKRVRLLPQSLWFWLGLIALVLLYYILRNFIPWMAP